MAGDRDAEIREMANDLCQARCGWSSPCRHRQFGRHCRDCAGTAIVRVSIRHLGTEIDRILRRFRHGNP